MKINKKDGTSYNTKECRTYNRIGNHCNDFCGAFGSDIRTDIDFYNIQDIRLLVELDGNEMEIRQLYSVPHYLELFSTDDYYCWTTNTNNKGKKVIFYDSTILTPSGSDDLEIFTKSDDDNSWGWIYQRGDISLQNIDGSIETLSLGATSQILVDFKTSDLKKNIVLTKDGCVKTVINGEEEENMPLLFFVNNNTLSLSCDGKRGQELDRLYKIEFKSFNELRYSEWTNKNHPSQGFLTLRIKCRDSSQQKKPWIGNVYFIPEVSPIVKRNIENNFIYFKGKNVCYLGNSSEQALDSKNRFKDSTDNNLDSPTLSFRIGDGLNNVELQVYRSLLWKQISNKNIIIKNIISKEDIKPPIAIILQKNIKIKSVDSKGYSECTPTMNEYLDYFKDPQEIIQENNYNSSDAFSSYIYLSTYEDRDKDKVRRREIEKVENSILLSVSDKQIDKYIFYYWSGESEFVPIKLECTKLEARKYKFNIPSIMVGKAVIFQSLRDCSPNFYFRPFYADEQWKWQHYINRYNVVNADYIIKSYLYAVEHNVYYCIFPAIANLQNRKNLTDFIRSYIQLKKYHLSRKDVEDLTRLVKELAMDWFFVDRNLLFKGLNKENKEKMRENMKKLLLNSPIGYGDRANAQRFVGVFLQQTTPFNQRNGKIPRQFLKYLDDFSNYDGRDKTEDRICFLNKVVITKNLFTEICRILNI